MQAIADAARAVATWWEVLPRRQKLVLSGVLLLTLAGAAFRIRGVVERPVWEDEAYTWKDSQIPFWRLVWWKHDPAHGPVSHILVRGSMILFGTDAPWVMRLPSLSCGILCIVAAFWLGRVVRGDALGLVAAALVAVDPNMVDQSQQARMYTMLALVTMLALAQSVRLLRDPPETRKPWIVLGVLLAVQFWINFGAAALWLALAAALGLLVARDRIAGDPKSLERAARMTRGAVVAYSWAAILAARGLWRMWIFVKSDRGITSATFSETLAAMARGAEQLVGAGIWSVAVLLAVLAGLVVLWRMSRPVALLLVLTAAATLAMIIAGRSVHHMIAVRYFTVLQPVVWLSLAALATCGRGHAGRLAAGGGLAALVGVLAWQSTHIDRWVDVNTWRYARAASRFISEARDGGDRVVCTPDVNFGWVARYYDLLDRNDQTSNTTTHGADGATWVMAYMFDPRSEGAIRALVDDARLGEHFAAEREQIVAAVRDRGLAVVRLDAGRFDTWVYDAARDDFVPAATIVADRPTGVRTAAAEGEAVR